MIGASCLHGPHHEAQKSITIGTSLDRATTFSSNVSVDTSIIHGEASVMTIFVAHFTYYLRDFLPFLVLLFSTLGTTASHHQRSPRNSSATASALPIRGVS